MMSWGGFNGAWEDIFYSVHKQLNCNIGKKKYDSCHLWKAVSYHCPGAAFQGEQQMEGKIVEHGVCRIT